MALLNVHRRWLGLAGCVLLLGCTDTEALGHADGFVRACSAPADCAAVSGEAFKVQAYFDAHVSRFAPHGFYAYFELEREDGGRGVLELDVPLDDAGDSVASERVSYRELDGDKLRFDSMRAEGELQLPRTLVDDSAPACGCEDGLFNLRFTAPGPDGALGTADDLERELYYGHLSRSEEPCLAQLTASNDPGLRVQMRECTTPPPAASPSVSPPLEPSRPTRASTTTCSHPDCYRDDGSYTTVESGCGGTSYNDSGCGGTSNDPSSSGCGSDSSNTDSGGCGGDSKDKKSSNGGCEGDTSNASSSSCSTAHVSSRGLRSFLGTGLPLLLVCLWQALRGRRQQLAAAATPDRLPCPERRPHPLPVPQTPCEK